MDKRDRFLVLRESVGLLLANPVLFFPKILVALLYGFGTLLGVSLAEKLLPVLMGSVQVSSITGLQGTFFSALLLIFLTIFAYFLDLFFSGLYPVLVEQARKGKISFKGAFSGVKGELGVVFVAGIIVWVLIFAVSSVESGLVLFFRLNSASIFIFFVITFAFAFLFYFLFPIIVFQKKNVSGSLRHAVKWSLSNKRKVFFYSLIPFSVSIIKFVVAFFASDPGMMVLFWALTVIAALIYSVHAVVSQLLYSYSGTHDPKKG